MTVTKDQEDRHTAMMSLKLIHVLKIMAAKIMAALVLIYMRRIGM